jgi:hypothetical protein
MALEVPPDPWLTTITHTQSDTFYFNSSFLPSYHDAFIHSLYQKGGSP